MIRILRAGPDLADVAASVMIQELEARIAQRGHASIAVSGGRTPWPVFERLGEAQIPWGAVNVFQVDERVAPPGSADRNLTGLAETLLERVSVVAHPMPVDAPDLEAAADQYAETLPPSLDIVHLGRGDDGHTASLVPREPVALVEDRLVAITDTYRGHRRMTLTRPAIDGAGLIVWIVSGSDKAQMIDRLVAGDTSIPAGLISQERAVLVTDVI